MNKRGFFNFKVIAKSVCGIGVVVGAFLTWLSLQYDKPILLPWGIFIIILGIVGAILITLIIRAPWSRRRRRRR